MFQVTKLAATAMVAAAMMIGGAAAQTVLVASDTHPDGYPTVEAVKYFGQLVSERTAGRYSVEGMVEAYAGLIRQALGSGAARSTGSIPPATAALRSSR